MAMGSPDSYLSGSTYNTTMKKIIVATDFSTTATHAAQYALEMAMALEAELLLFHSFELPPIYGEVPISDNAQAIRQEAVDGLERLKGSLLSRSPHPISIDTEVREGGFFTELKAACELHKPYAVVMGCQGTTATERLLFGSHAVKAMKQLPWPVITVPKDFTFSPVKKIALALDFDKTLETTPVQAIQQWVMDWGATLHILNAGNEKTYQPNIVHESHVLSKLLGNISPKFHFITDDDFAEGIMSFTESNGIDLLVVLPKRHHFIEKLLYHSYTKQLVLRSHVPVMALHL
jgi:nucleotide-binding universal stress UspA family protein